LLNPTNAEEETMKYFMERYLDECNFNAYKNIAILYLQKYSTNDAEIYATLGLECINKKVDNNQLQSCIESTKKAVELQNAIPFYYEQLAQLYILKKDKKQAAKSLHKAQELAKLCNHDMKYYNKLQMLIDNL
jgi:Flp pilus assembly protein TadD